MTTPFPWAICEQALQMRHRGPTSIDQCQRLPGAKKIRSQGTLQRWLSSRQLVIRGRRMLYDDYLRDEAAKYRMLAEQTEDEALKRELLELAAVCEEVANAVEDNMTAG
jgi:hypothetical protein